MIRGATGLVIIVLVVSWAGRSADTAEPAFSYFDALFGVPTTLSVNVGRIDPNSGIVEFTGNDDSQPSQPFTWDWGDGTSGEGFFPQTHEYTDRQRNYVVTVRSRYSDGVTDNVRVLVRFVPLSPLSVDAPPNVTVQVPAAMPALKSVRAPYTLPERLTVFGDRDFPSNSREATESVLTIAAAIQLRFANENVVKPNGKFEQVVLRDPTFAGMYSVWYTDPMALGAGDAAFGGTVSWSSLFHEMAHNVTLNSPANFHWGYRQDGPANTIFSEMIANVFQHATAYELLNNRERYDIGDDLALEIEQRAVASMAIVRDAYEDYRSRVPKFVSWNDGNTPEDETFATFMIIAYKFFEHAELAGQGYEKPVQRLMAFLQRFNPSWEEQFSARENSVEAERFRATLMVAALSHAFDADLRTEFRAMQFPVDDAVFREVSQ